MIGLRALAALLLTLATPVAAARAETDAAATARLFDTIRDRPAQLRLFLRAMPKGGDLHSHLWGVPYAESLLDEAGTAGFCVTAEGTAIAAPPCTAGRTVPATGLATHDPDLYARLVDALSMRGHVAEPGAGALAGHDRFFATFARFGPIAAHAPGRLLAEARRIAANDHVSYLETQSNPQAVGAAGALALERRIPVDDPAAAYAALAPDLPRLLAAARADVDTMERDSDRRLNCAARPVAAPCAVLVRYQAVAIRGLPPQVVFGQLTLAFALAAADPRYVGVNIAGPEDGTVALADYDRHMAMLRWLKTRYPTVPLSLHAGELAPGLVPPAALADHIGKAVAVAGARRIGHGVAIADEADAPATLARMARDGVAVEIALTSNDVILGVRGRDHPLALYRAAGVPFVIATDDEGVARSDMTQEYVRAATEQGLRYDDLKAAARAALHYAFLTGDSLWATGAIGTAVPACRTAVADGVLAGACRALVDRSDKARAEWRLERELATFETAKSHSPF